MKAIAFALFSSVSLLFASCQGPAPTPNPPTPPAPQPAPGEANAKLVEAHNKAREAQGLPPLVQSPALTKAAQIHSDDMARTGRMSHTGSDGSSPFQRMEKAGYRYGYAGENVAYGQVDVPAVMKAWMNSSGHRSNILSRNYKELGVAVANGRDGRPYWTATFGASIDGVARGTEPRTFMSGGPDASSIRREP